MTGMLARLYVSGLALAAGARDREDGQALVEYALILAFIAIVCVGALIVIGGKVNGFLIDIGNRI